MSIAVGIQAGETAPRTWLITDVSGGLGQAISEQLLAFGERVVGTVPDLESAADLTERHPGMFYAEVLDVTDGAATREVVDRTFARFTVVDVIVGTADSTELIRAALPHLRAQAGARFVQISSADESGSVEAGSSEEGASELAALGIGVTFVEPGAGDTFLVAEAVIESVDEEPAPPRLVFD